MALVAFNASKVAFGALNAPKATLGRFRDPRYARAILVKGTSTASSSGAESRQAS